MAYSHACGSSVRRILGYIEGVLVVDNWAYGYLSFRLFCVGE
jgi:hypothetical protein